MTSSRHLPKSEAKALFPGADHYTAYVGPPDRYDFMGASQFRLLCTLGLREHHQLLDVGCGSLRAGRLLIPYLNPGHYFGVEPNAWLIEDAVRCEIGGDLIRIKQPRFSGNAEFDFSEFGCRFDYVIAQSVFSHCGLELITQGLLGIAQILEPQGIVVATFCHSEGAVENELPGWIYPGVVRYRPATILSLIEKAGLHGRAIPWFHPKQVWYLIAKSPDRLAPDCDRHLSGAVLFDSQFVDSCR